MKTNKKMTALSLLDLLLREGPIENGHGITFGSFEPELLKLSYVVYNQRIGDLEFSDVELLSDPMDPEAFIKEFNISSIADLERITLNELWKLYRANRADVTLFAGEDTVKARIGDGVKTLKEALVYAGRALALEV